MKKKLQNLYLLLIVIFLYAPIMTLMVLSFNSSRTRAKWGGFTGKWYVSLFQDEAIMSTLYNTLIIALLSALIATVIGTLASIGIQSMNRKFRTFMLGVTNIPPPLPCRWLHRQTCGHGCGCCCMKYIWRHCRLLQSVVCQ